MKMNKAVVGVLAGAITFVCGPAAILAQGPPPPPPPGYQGAPPPGYGWDAPPSQYQEMERHAFHMGIEGAQKDFANHRNPDVNNRDEYRHPHVPDYEKDAFRSAFRHGYDTAREHLGSGWGR